MFLIYEISLVFLAAFFLTFLLLIAALAISRKTGVLQRSNFRGNPVSLVGGGAFVACSVLLLSASGGAEIGDIVRHATRFALLSFGLLGSMDDCFGDRSTGGFRGHFRALLNERRLTTGALKAVGGGIAALWCGILLQRGSHSSAPDAWGSVLAIGLFIALAANTSNLLDTRPGRTASVSILMLLPLQLLLLLHWQASFTLSTGYDTTSADYFIAVAVLFGSLLAVFQFDSQARVMLGDTGSNAIGAGIGVLYAAVLPLWGIIVGVLLLAAFQIWCEKHSLSKLIEETPWLRRLDRKIGVR